MGFCEYGMGGATPNSWISIDTFNNITHANLDSWEALQLRKMSESYCSYLHKGKDPSFPPPYTGLTDIYSDDEKLGSMRNNVDSQWKRLKAARKAAKQQEKHPPQNIKVGDAPML